METKHSQQNELTTTPRTLSTALLRQVEKLKRDPNQDIAALDVAGTLLDLATVQRGILRLSNNFGVNFGEPKAKIIDWWNELTADGWSRERFEQTVSWLM